MQMHGYELASPSASKCCVASCVAWAGAMAPCVREWFNGLTLLAYLNYTPRLRYTHEDQIHYSRTRCVARAPIGKH